MPEKRIVCWVQLFGDREYLMLQWHDPVTRKRKSRSAGTCNPLVAEQRRADLEYELNNGLHREPSRMTWEAFRQRFEDEYAAPRRPDTRRNYRVTLDLFEQLCCPRTVGGVTEATVSAFAAALRKRPGCQGPGQQPGTIKVRLQFLHTALQWAHDQKLIPEVPKFPAVKVPRKKPQAIPAEAFERLLAKAPDQQMRVFLLAGWLAGLRLNEALALEWEEAEKAPWLDLARNRIWLPAGFVKADEDQWVPLDPTLREELLALPRQGQRVFRFVEARSGKPVGCKAVGNRVAELARLAGVRLTMKSLRKGFGCYHAGRVSAHVLQKLMRHSSIRVTMDYYASVDDAVEAAVVGGRPPGVQASDRQSR